MAGVRIVTDSTCDLPPRVTEELGITVVPLYVHFGDKTYLDRVELSAEDFHRRLATTNILPTTSHPSVAAFEDVYRRILREGDSIISIHHSAKLGATFATAQAARNAILAPPSQLAVIDSLNAGYGLGFIAMEAAKRARAGAFLPDLVSVVNRMIFQTHVIFFTETLQYLQHGGRMSKAAQAMSSSSATFRPLLRLEDGVIVPFERTRTRAKAIEGLCEFIEDFPHIEEMAIMHSNSPNDVETILQRIAPIFPRERVFVGQFAAVLGAHVGPGAMGVTVYEGGVF